MPPRRSKAAGGDDRCPTLKLIMLKGPLLGQISEFSPRSVIRIGRIARGNTLAIKDDGVSSKHLRIQVEATPDSGQCRWVITDLGSSNGTILNEEGLEESAVLSDGDVIKIGEQTSIKVEFEANVVGSGISSTSTRKNVRRGVRHQSMDLGAIDELGFGDNEDEKKTDDVVEIEAIQEKNVSTKGTKSSEENVTELKDLNTEENKDLGQNGAKGLPRVSTRRTRSSRAVEAVIDPSVIEGKKTRGSKKMAVQAIPEETEKEEEKVTEDMNSGKEDGSIGLGSTSGAKENCVNIEKGKMVADLDTMKMGEWLDFLEVYLPQQIIEDSEAMIAEMRQDAERYHKFRVQQMKLKG